MGVEKTISRRVVAKHLSFAAGLTAFGRSAAQTIKPTPEQGEGPFHPITEHNDTDTDMTMIEGQSERAVGDMILVRGRIQNTEGRPIPNANVDIWQANHFGRYTHPNDTNTAPVDPNFQGWTLVTTGSNGNYGIKTIMPGPYPLVFLEPENRRWRCRHIHFKVTCAGYSELTTQMYFSGDPWIQYDGMIARTPEHLRSALVVEESRDEGTGLPLYQFDITLKNAPTGSAI